ncbi:hypothetical protein C7S18_04185 [Ahniella affigens]|uniref:Uncharacterized protein n=1 Tax=Ahniella affigens TaxID=2021234 RepID=A0A2P1PNL9_9GAMM|nr:hypothetical protein C7S18_04185 [Ahniella affigens]
MITVPACAHCNNGATAQDEQFRLYLAATTAYVNDDATKVWIEQAMRTLIQNQRIKRELFGNLPTGGEPVVRPDGQIGVPIHWPARFYVPVLERMTRGLYYHHQKRVLGSAAECEVQMLSALPEPFHELTDPWPGGQVGGDVFTYRFGIVDDLRSFWIFQFYRAHWATVETFPKGAGRVPQ